VAEQQQYPWVPGSATGIGSMPGTDPAEAMRVIAGELPGFPHLPELPDRGPGAEITGRTAALLIDMPVEITPRGWRLADHPGRDMARAKSMLSSDLDVMEEVLQGYEGPLKIQVCGPWTLAATLELNRTMDAALRDPGAVADLTASLAEAAANHAADVAKRVPGARLVTQIDEPALTAIVNGEVPTASGLSRIPAIDQGTISERLGQVLANINGYTAVHCCAASVRFEIIRAAGAHAVAFDLGLLRRGEEEAVAELAETGMGLFVGLTGDTARKTAERIVELWHRMGSEPNAAQTVITPPCGLAADSPQQARDTLKRCREAAAILPEMGP
jgi:methionine synthase II (cobalamin-independent)